MAAGAPAPAAVVGETRMSITRIEGARAVDAASAKLAPKPQQPATTRKSATEEAPPAAAEPKAPAPAFKPYALSFRFEKDINRVVVKVIDPETGELLREVPPEEVIAALKRLRKTPGALVDEEV